MRISIVGTGYVGLVSGACFAEIGHECLCVDLDPSKVERINRGEAPIHEEGLDAMLQRHAGKSLRATTDLAAAVRWSEVTFIAVGTPFNGETIDLSYIEAAARSIGEALAEKDVHHTVIVKSTVVPGTTDDVVRPILEEASGRVAGTDFSVGMNPEFLTEGTAISDFMIPDRIVLGGASERAIAVQREIYSYFVKTPVVEVNNKTAEMIKYTSNSVLATLISFSNEIANVCSAIGDIDVADVMRGAQLARYFGVPNGDDVPALAPITSFLWAGCGYGGSCLPKDTKALSAHANRHGERMPLIDAVIDTNARQPQRMVDRLERHFDSLQGRHITILGLAFKEDTDDVRESPALVIAKLLDERGAVITAYDPIAGQAATPQLPPNAKLASSLEEAAASAEALLLVTRWAEFGNLPGILSGRENPPVVVDGRRMLNPSSIARYDGIGL